MRAFHRLAAPWTRWDRGLAGGCVLAFILLTVLAAAGVRGTDQYWYVADVASLIDDGQVQTNHIYPLVLERDIALPRPFIHNIVPVYVAALLASGLGPYAGWIGLNVACSVTTAGLIYATVRHTASHPPAVLAGIAYLMLPAVFWQATQPLAESFIAVLVAGLTALAVLQRPSSLRYWLLLGGGAVLLYASRHTFILLFLLLPLAAAVAAPHRSTALQRMGSLVLLFGGAWLALPWVLPSYLEYSYVEAINGAAAGNLLFAPPADALDLRVLAEKAVEAVQTQFALLWRGAVMFWPFNGLAVLALLLPKLNRQPRARRLAIAAGAALLLHVLTAVLYRNQFRYTVIVTPPVLSAAAVSLTALRRRVWMPDARTLGTALLGLGLPVLSALAVHARSSSQTDQAIRAQLTALVDAIPRDATVAVDYGGVSSHRWTLIGYVLRPRRVLHLSAEAVPPPDGHRMRRRLHAEWLLSPPQSPYRSPACQTAAGPTALPPPFDTLSVYRCPVTAPPDAPHP